MNDIFWFLLFLSALGLLILGVAFLRSRRKARAALSDNARLQLIVQQKDALLDRDVLTGLIRRAGFMKIAADGVRTDAMAVLLFDIDGLKSVNNIYGLATGDKLLIEFANILASVCPEGGVAARVGGDAFSLLLPQTSLHEAEAIGKSVCARFAEAEIMGGLGQLNRTVSGGVTHVAAHQSLENALSEAEMALGAAKEDGRNRIVTVDPVMRTRRKKALLEPTLEDMRKGIDAEEFTYFVQPIYSLDTNRLVGVEALIRWVTDDGTVRLPREFMHMFTRQYKGIINRPVNAANEVVASFARPDSDIFCAFNISSSFLNRSFEPSPRWLDQLLMGINPKRTVFEIVESGQIENTTAARNMLNFLRAQGVRIALDDFGTGHSNLARLVDFPVDIVKLDRTFVSQLSSNTRHRAVVNALMSLSEELGFEVIAEGVETPDELQALRDLGVPMAQGYYLGLPQPLQEWNARDKAVVLRTDVA